MLHDSTTCSFTGVVTFEGVCDRLTDSKGFKDDDEPW